MKVLCTGDVHIGRRASSIHHSLDERLFSTSSIWDDVVETAIVNQVDLLLVSGDLVDKANSFFESIGPLEHGLQRLAGAGIETYAVSGNHDHDVLPRLAETFAGRGFSLIGRGGRWERSTVFLSGQPALHIDGWSFPREHVTQNPLDSYQSGSNDGVPVLGLLHADLDQTRSDYAPVSISELSRQPVHLWLLGHVHKSQLYDGGPGAPVLYPGSPMAMDPGEPGPHGVWLAEILPGEPVRPVQIPLSRVRYHQIEIDLTGKSDQAACNDWIARQFRELVQTEIRRHLNDPVRCLSCRIQLTGATNVHRDLPTMMLLLRDQLYLMIDGVTAFVDRVTCATRPAIDLEALSSGLDPVSELARLVLAFDSPAPLERHYFDLLDRATRRAQTVSGSPAFGHASADPSPEPDSIRNQIREQAVQLLSVLVAQKETA